MGLLANQDNMIESTTKLWIERIPSIPDKVIESVGILPDYLEGNHKVILSIQKHELEIISLWLKFYLLGDTKVIPVLVPKHLIFKPLVELILSDLKVLQELYLKLIWYQEIYSSPFEALWWINFELYKNRLEINGILGDVSFSGKRKEFNYYSKEIKKYENEDFSRLKEDIKSPRFFLENTKNLHIETEAEKQIKEFCNNYRANIGIAEGIKRITLETKNFNHWIAYKELSLLLSLTDSHFKRTWEDNNRITSRVMREYRNNPKFKHLKIKTDGSLLFPRSYKTKT